MVKDAPRCRQFVSLFVVVLAIRCPSSALANLAHTYYNMTNGFLDVIQPTAQFGGMNKLFSYFDIFNKSAANLRRAYAHRLLKYCYTGSGKIR